MLIEPVDFQRQTFLCKDLLHSSLKTAIARKIELPAATVDKHESHRNARSCINRHVSLESCFPFELLVFKNRSHAFMKIKDCIAYIDSRISKVYFSDISARQFGTPSP